MLAAVASSTAIQIHVIGSLDGSREIGTESAEPRLKRPRRASANAGGGGNVSFCILAIVGTDKGRWSESFKKYSFIWQPYPVCIPISENTHRRKCSIFPQPNMDLKCTARAPGDH